MFSVKASRYLTHVRRLNDPAQPIERLLAAAVGLGPSLGPILLQFPPNLRADPAKLSTALGHFPSTVRVAVESRHPSWHEDQIRKVLEDHGAAWVLVDPSDRSRPRWRTADWGYVRFHQGSGAPSACYNRSPLETWAKRLAALWSPSEDIYCYFNNDGNSCAPRDAVLRCCRRPCRSSSVQSPCKARDSSTGRDAEGTDRLKPLKVSSALLMGKASESPVSRVLGRAQEASDMARPARLAGTSRELREGGNPRSAENR